MSSFIHSTSCGASYYCGLRFPVAPVVLAEARGRMSSRIIFPCFVSFLFRPQTHTERDLGTDTVISLLPECDTWKDVKEVNHLQSVMNTAFNYVHEML